MALWGIASALAPATAQVAPPNRLEPTIRFDAVGASSYYWRGIRESGGPVFQVSAAGGLNRGPVSIVTGGWANYGARTARPVDQPVAEGESAWSELDLWAQAAVHPGALTLAGGILASAYRRVDRNTDVTEIFWLARWQHDRWRYALSTWHAISGAKGTYLEPAITFYHLVNPFAGPALSLATSLRAGVQAGRRQETPPTLVPGAEGTGLTHMALSPRAAAALNLPGRFGLTASWSLELEWRRDPATRVGADGSLGARFRVRAPIQVGVRWPYQRSP
jgi:hypothetical protein